MNGLKPNEYDLEVTGNGCGSEGLKSIIGTSDFLNFIFKRACQKHDFHYSKYSPLTRKQADDILYENMVKLIKAGNYGFFKKLGYTLIAKDYWRLVRWYGKSAYAAYDPNAIMPSYQLFIHKKILKLNKPAIRIDSMNRWYLVSEAKELGYI